MRCGEVGFDTQRDTLVCYTGINRRSGRRYLDEGGERPGGTER